jgi:type II secretory pathway component PulC
MGFRRAHILPGIVALAVVVIVVWAFRYPRSAPPSSPIDKNELRSKGCIKVREGEWVVDAALQEKARQHPETIVDQYRLKPVLLDKSELKIDGVEISFLSADSFLRRVEFQQGDRIVAVNRRRLETVERAMNLMNEVLGARHVVVEFVRNGKILEHKVSFE